MSKIDKVAGDGQQNVPSALTAEASAKTNNAFDYPLIVVHRSSTTSEDSGAGGVSASAPGDGDGHWHDQQIEAAQTAACIEEDGKLSPRMRTIQMMMRGAYCNLTGDCDGVDCISQPEFESNSKLFTIDMKKSTICQHMARFYHKFGIRHFLLVGVLAIYSLLGGLLFQAIERDNEYTSLRTNKEALEAMIGRLAENLTVLLEVRPSDEQQKAMQQLITEYYQTMLKIEGKYIGSVFHKYEHIVFHLSWYFESSVFYAITLFTTIGYGTIACQTTLGRIVSIFYAFDIGQLLLHLLTFCHNCCHNICSSWLRSMAFRILEIDEEAAQVAKAKVEQQQQQQQNNNIVGGPPQRQRHNCWVTNGSAQMPLSESVLISDEVDDEDVDFVDDQPERVVPLFVSVPIVLVYLAFIAIVVSCFDWSNGTNESQLSFFEAFYFAFISLSTIGLGDVMPNNIEFSPILALLFVGGLALLSVVNLTIYQHIQRLFLIVFDHLENYLDEVYFARPVEDDCAFFVFRSLIPNIQLLTLALPIFSENPRNNQTAERIPEPELLQVRRLFSISRTPSLLQSAHYHPRKINRTRTFSTAKSEGQEQNSDARHRATYHTVHGTDFRPTLGILSTAPQSPSRSRGTSIRSRRTSAHKRAGSPSSIRSSRKRAVTVGCHFDYSENDCAAGKAENCQKMYGRASSTAKTVSEKEAIVQREAADVWMPEAELITPPTERRIHFKKVGDRTASPQFDDGITSTAPTAAVVESSSGSAKLIRRTHSERVSQRKHHPHSGLLYVIDETEPHQQTIAGGERLRPRRQRLRPNVGHLSSAPTESGEDENNSAPSPSSPRRVQIRVQPPAADDRRGE
uniref:Potassium channel domain-containing protein n=1 Tax=Globodera rostochiensis TaxID=31243 RepID=A0A914I750_GLORO